MVDSVHSGYKSAAVAVVFAGTQQIDSLLDNEWTDLSNEIDNSILKNVMMDLELVLGTAVFVGADSLMELYAVPSIDDTNFADWTGNVVTDEQENNEHYICSFTTSGATGIQRLTKRSVLMPIGKFKFGFRSRAGVTLNAAGNDLKYRPWQFASQ